MGLKYVDKTEERGACAAHSTLKYNDLIPKDGTSCSIFGAIEIAGMKHQIPMHLSAAA